MLWGWGSPLVALCFSSLTWPRQEFTIFKIEFTRNFHWEEKKKKPKTKSKKIGLGFFPFLAVFYLGKLEPIFCLFSFLFFFSFRSLQIVVVLMYFFLTAFHNSKVEKENKTKQKRMGKKEKERYGNQICKNIITKWKHLTFPRTHFKNLKFAWFSLVQKNKHELSSTDLYCSLSAVQHRVGHICSIVRTYASSFLSREPEARDFWKSLTTHKRIVWSLTVPWLL